MADVTDVSSGNQVNISTSPGVILSSTSTPFVVSSGNRPLKISTSSSVDGNVFGDVVETQTSPVPPAAATTPVQTTVGSSTSGIVIRAASSTDSQVSPTTPLSVNANPVTASSGITIRSSASAQTPASNGAINAPVSVATTPALPTTPVQVPVSVTSFSSQPIVIRQGNTGGNSNDAIKIQTNVSTAPSQPASAVQPPQSSAAPASPQIQVTGAVDNQPKPNTVNSLSADTASPIIRRAPSAIIGRPRPKSTVYEQPRQPAMTWSELTNKFDLVKVCGFALVVLAIAFASIMAGKNVPFCWLLAAVSGVSVALFATLRL